MVAAIFLFLHLFFALLVFFLVIAFVTGAPFVPSTNPVAQSMIGLARIKPDMNVYDLGSGNGKLLFLAAKQGAIALGFEINPFLVLLSWMRTLISPYRNRITTRWQNFWTADLSRADVVFIYLLPWRMEQLKRKLQNELKPGSLVVSNSFIFPGWNILRHDREKHVYVFRV